eukprot:5760350-Prymnesium_polylepis.1
MRSRIAVPSRELGCEATTVDGACRTRDVCRAARATSRRAPRRRVGASAFTPASTSSAAPWPPPPR